MKVIQINPSNLYSCQYCGNEFRIEEDLVIFPQETPLCSNLCRFRLCYSIFIKYDYKTLFNLAKSFNLPLKNKETSHNLAYKLSKKFHNKVLSNIKQLAHGSGSNNMSRKRGLNGSKILAQAHTFPYIRECEPRFEPVPNKPIKSYQLIGGKFA